MVEWGSGAFPKYRGVRSPAHPRWLRWASVDVPRVRLNRPPCQRGACARVVVGVALAGLVATGACAARRPLAAIEGPAEGLASWYGAEFHGRRAADGSRYNMYALTAAHQTLAFGTRVRVTNLANDRSVEVTITDRGPFVEGRIIDVSFAAAQRLGMVGQGVTRVRLEVVG